MSEIWLNASKTAEQLSISTDTLAQWRSEGKLVLDTHYKVQSGARPWPDLYNVPLCKEVRDS